MRTNNFSNWSWTKQWEKMHSRVEWLENQIAILLSSNSDGFEIVELIFMVKAWRSGIFPKTNQG